MELQSLILSAIEKLDADAHAWFLQKCSVERVSRL
jgi:hypothetical protein